MKTFLFSLLLLTLLGCSHSEITRPPSGNDANLVGTVAIPFNGGATIKAMEGLYNLSGGSESLGTHFVCKVSKYKVTFFSNKEGIHIILKYGYKPGDGSIQFSGFWRKTESPTQGIIEFSVSAADGATDLLDGIAAGLKLEGVFSNEAMTLTYERPFTAFAIANPFLVFAHHGIQTTVDPPFAENSLNVILNGEDYGVNGLELDVRMTKDNVPILIHDPTINIRLTLKGPLFGYWDQYNYSVISRFVTLIDGQQVPTVEEALNAFIDETTMKYFWMDIKGNEGIFKYLEPIVRKAYERAVVQGRDVVIFAGLPSSETIGELEKQPTYHAINTTFPYSDPLPLLAEETIEKAIENDCQFFGPRYTLGLLLPEVEKAHDHNIKVISWTLNSKGLIVNYLQNGKFDGMITDYPAYVVYNYYTMF
jgi:glycerophosphoryl diester phosphodiesterase